MEFKSTLIVPHTKNATKFNSAQEKAKDINVSGNL